MRKVKVKEGQSSWDIAIQEYGAMEGFFYLVDDNPEVFTSLNVVLHAGQMLNIRDEVLDETVVDYYRKKGISPKSGITAEEFAQMPADFHEDDFDGGDFNTNQPHTGTTQN